MKNSRVCLVGGLCVLVFSSVAVSAQGVDVEPNHPCDSAQLFGAVAYPFQVTGTLAESTPGDVDFFRFFGVPGAEMQVSLFSSGDNPLYDPMLGVFDSTCNLLLVDDDGGGFPNAFAYFTVPDDGRFVLAANSCCDYTFTESYFSGSYTLRVGPREFAGPVTGRLVDADTGMGLSGDFPTYASAVLLRCRYYGCYDWVQYVSADADGRISFAENFYGERLSPGDYQVAAWANLYENHFTEVFTLEVDASLDLGDLQMQPRRFIGSIQGRVLDALDGTPLPSEPPAWTGLYLYACPNGNDCYYYRTQAWVDREGRFFIDGRASQIEIGYYQVQVYTEQYQPRFSDPVFVGEDEALDLGDLLMQPVRLQMHPVDGCSAQEIGSRNCVLTVQLRNGTSKRLMGEVWASGQVYYTGTPGFYSVFQLGRVGTTNPMPQKVNLKAGQRANFDFQLRFPANLSENSLVCVQAFAGLNPNPTFNPENVRDFYCFWMFEGSLQPLSEKDARRMLKEQRSRPR